MFSFGPLLLLLGLTVLWLDHRGVKPPSFIAWALAGWVIISTIASGPSPLLLLLIAAALLLIGARQRREVSQSRPADFLHLGSLNRAQSQ